jgi:hypothetical protein
VARIPDNVKHRFREALETSKGHARFKKMLAQGTDENFKWAYELAHEYGYGKAPQYSEIELNDVTNRPDAETLNAAIRSLENHSNGNGLEKGK